jgi:hypothetical protein
VLLRAEEVWWYEKRWWCYEKREELRIKDI